MKIPTQFLLCLVGVTYGVTPFEFGKQLEEELPGSVNSFLIWSNMEMALESVEAVFQGRRPVPTSNTDERVLGYYILSTNPDMSDSEFEDHMFRIFQRPNVLSSEWKSTTIDALTVPHWFFIELLIRRELGFTLASTAEHMLKFVRAKTKGSPDPKFSTDVAIRNIASIWWLFGLPTHDELGLFQYPAEPVLTTGNYTMRPETKKMALEHFCLSSMRTKKRARNT